MGVTKLIYDFNPSPMRVVYKSSNRNEKSVQRFLSIDPLASKFPAWSSYNYVMSNPIMLIDPTGREAEDWVGKKGKDGRLNLEWNDKIQSEEQANAVGYDFYADDNSLVQNVNIAGEQGDLLLKGGGERSFYKNSDMVTAVGKRENNNSAQIGEDIPALLGNTFSVAGTAAGYFETGYRVNAQQVFKYAQRVDGKVRSAATLTRANRISSNTAVRGLSKAGTGLAVVSAGLTIYDGLTGQDGWQNHHTADLVISGAIYGTALSVPVVGWIAGCAYFAVDVGFQISTGKSLTQNIFDP